MENIFANKDTFKKVFKTKVENTFAKKFEKTSLKQKYQVLGGMVKEYVAVNWRETKETIQEKQLKQTFYFSMEFLMGRLVTNNIYNAGLRPVIEEGLKDLGLDINDLEHEEQDAGLGNGGLGRLAACFMDSAVSIGLPVNGNCIRYNFGFFEQKMIDGYQHERPDMWLNDGNIWEVKKEEDTCFVRFYGELEGTNHKNYMEVKAVPYDMPLVGDSNGLVNTLRLWSAEPTDNYPVDVDPFEYNSTIRSISGQLYPEDATDEGKILRLQQQYFFNSAGINSILKRHKEVYGTLDNLPDKVCFQINDTHPALIVPELMRVLMDDNGYSYDDAWAITTKVCAYTNHTILAEALEKWPLRLFKPLLPRIYQICVEIDKRFRELLATKFKDANTINKLAILTDEEIRMAHLSIAGSFSVNGVAALHTDILKKIEMKDFHELYPGKYNNKTNGITHRRWLYHTNPELMEILKRECGEEIYNDITLLSKLNGKEKDAKLQKDFDTMKRARKQALADRIYAEQGIKLDVNSVFDIQVKRLHEYKRQLMNALHIMHVYNKLKNDAEFKKNYHPHSFIFGAKSAPSYDFAKKIIKLITTIADKVNNDKDVENHLKVVFVENYNVTYAETIMPAADLSEQISTASKEASGTGNMKFMMNGAITIGTMDGANVEIREHCGADNIVIFGLNSDEVNEIYSNNTYNPMDYYNSNKDVKLVIDQLTDTKFWDNRVDDQEFEWIQWQMKNKDQYLVLKDFASYIDAHERANDLYKNRAKWLEMSIMNTANSSFFSTDRTMEDYNRDIWHLEKIKK